MIYGPRKSVSIKFANRNSANFTDPPIFSGPFLIDNTGKNPRARGPARTREAAIYECAKLDGHYRANRILPIVNCGLRTFSRLVAGN